MFGRRRLLGFGLLAATFVAGALAGAAVDRMLMDEPDRDDDRDRRRSYIIDRVEMSSEQRAAIDSILERRSDRMRAIWREVRPRMDAVTDSARSEIMDVLTPEQRAEYERRLEERRRDRDGHEGRGDREDREDRER
jgi:Spy/CpxP family protein refolding chaperone